MYELVVNSRFAAAHNLRGYRGVCERLHGHNWQVEAVLAAGNLDELGMVADFRDVKKALGEILEDYDHRYLNELPQFEKVNPTTENIARFVAESLAGKLPDGVKVRSIAVRESENCCARYIVPE